MRTSVYLVPPCAAPIFESTSATTLAEPDKRATSMLQLVVHFRPVRVNAVPKVMDALHY
jgi:hypothetical protein